MPRGLSLYLDVVRFGAAMLVLVGHAGTQVLTGGFLWQFRAFGDPAVVVFFVLSGFVIAFVTSKPGVTARSYAIARLTRILSVCVPALVLTFLLDAMGKHYDPGLYDAIEHSDRPWAVQALAAITFLNEGWWGDIRPGSNGAYWSMGFEAWYYAAFGVACFARGWWRWAGTGLVLLAVGPQVTGMFPVWLVGAACYHACRRWRMPGWAGLALWAGTTVFALVFWAKTGLVPVGGVIYRKPLLEMWTDYAVGLWFALNIAGAWFAAPMLQRWLAPFERPIRAFASVTFTLYLVHFPVMVAVRALSPWAPSDWRLRLAILVIPGLVVAAMAYVTEYPRTVWRHLVTRLFRPVLPA